MVSIFSSKTETKLASHINTFNSINWDTILAMFWLRFGHILTVLGLFLITFLTRLKLHGLWSHLTTKSTLFLWTLKVSYLKKRREIDRKKNKFEIVWQLFIGGFHLNLVFPFVQFNSRIEALVSTSFANEVQKDFIIILPSFQNLFVVVVTWKRM